MNLASLRLLTWATIAGSVGSALLLASSDARVWAPAARPAPKAIASPALRLPVLALPGFAPSGPAASGSPR